MKITNLKISNYCGLRHLDVKLQKPVLLVAGANAAGKSSLQDAVRMALMADLGRVGLKKDAHALIRDGADAASISLVNADGDEYAVSINSSGKISDSQAGRAADTVLPFLLDMTAFIKSDNNTRRQLLAEITRTVPTADVVTKRLYERGCESDKVALVSCLIPSGIEHACKHAKQQATEAKGAWRAITGETYGEKKADNWTCQVPAVDQEADLAMKKELDELDALLDSNVRQLTLAEDNLSRESQNSIKRNTYRDSAAKLERLEKKLAADRKDLCDWEEKLEAAKDKASGKPVPKLFSCPCCDAQLYHDIKRPDAALLQWQDDGHTPDPEALAAIPQIENSVRLYSSAVANDKRDIEAAKQAAAMLASLPVAENVDNLQEIIRTLQQRISGIRADKKRVEAEYAAHNAKMREVIQAAGKTAKAAGFHADVMAWTKIAEALSPDGIPGELIAGALKPINDRLRQSAEDTGWMQVAIDADMNVTANGRPYALLSESEQWRCDAMITEAIALMSGQQMLMLDRMDVLDLPGRGECLAWLEILAENAEISTVIVCATLKAEPAEREGVQVVWLDGGERVAMKEAA